MTELIKCPECNGNNVFIHQGGDLCLCGECNYQWESGDKPPIDEWIPISHRSPERKLGNKIWATDGEVQFECECDQDGDYCNVYGKSFTHWMAAIGLPATPEADE